MREREVVVINHVSLTDGEQTGEFQQGWEPLLDQWRPREKDFRSCWLHKLRFPELSDPPGDEHPEVGLSEVRMPEGTPTRETHV